MTAGAVAVVLIGGLVVGAVAGGVAAIATAIAGAGALGGITLAGIMPSLVQSAVGGAETIYNFDFNKSDDQLLKELNQGFVSFAGVAGESLGDRWRTLLLARTSCPSSELTGRPCEQCLWF